MANVAAFAAAGFRATPWPSSVSGKGLAMPQLRIETGWPTRALWPNARPHLFAKRRAEKQARNEAYVETYRVAPPHWATGAERITLTIYAHPNAARTRDRDNLVAACKPHIDGIAKALGVDDSIFAAPVVEWGAKHRNGRLYFETGREP